MFFVQNAGPVIFLIFFIAAFGMVGGLYLAYLAHCFFLVVEQTAAGAVRVRWPDEIFTDWLWKAVYLLGLMTISLIPAFLLGQLLRPLAPPPSLLPWFAIAGIWFFFWPIAVLSSLSGNYYVNILRPIIVRRLLRCWPQALQFYAVTAVLVAGCATLVFLAISGGSIIEQDAQQLGLNWLAPLVRIVSLTIGLPLAALMLAATVLLYARLLGRLGWWLNQLEPTAAEAVALEQAEARRHDLPVAQAPGLPVSWAETAFEPTTYPDGTPQETFALKEDPLPDQPVQGVAPDREQQVIALLAEEVDAENPADEMEPAAPGPLPAFLGERVFRFPWYRTSVGAWLRLSLSSLILLGMARILILFWIP